MKLITDNFTEQITQYKYKYINSIKEKIGFLSLIVFASDIFASIIHKFNQIRSPPALKLVPAFTRYIVKIGFNFVMPERKLVELVGDLKDSFAC